jgi:transposase
MTTEPIPSPSSPDQPAPSAIREKLPPERIALMRDWVECTTRSFKHIGHELGVSASTVSRYAAEGNWQRPPGAALPSRTARPNPAPERRRKAPRAVTGERRQEITEKLWRLAERHAEELEHQPIAVAARALQPLARLTRTLGELDKHAHPPLPPGEYENDNQPRRSLHELRDEFVAHLERIEREEREYEERYYWTFENGAGI